MARAKGGRKTKGRGRGKRSKEKGEKVVVRLMGEGQYYIDKDTLDEVNRIDNRMVRLLDEDVDEHTIRESIAAMRMLVKSRGRKVKDDTIIPSHIIIPSVDITVEEAREVFKGEGLVPEGMID